MQAETEREYIKKVNKNGPNCSEGWASVMCDRRTQSPTEYTFLHAYRTY